jgi:hypothetical protein
VLTQTERFEDKSKVDKGDKHAVELIEARKDTAKAFKPAEKPLNFITLFVHLLVVVPGSDPIGIGWDYGDEIKIKG